MNSKDKTAKYIFWIPMLYNFNIRLKNSPSKILSWMFINIFPTFYYALICETEINIMHILTLCIFWIGIFSLYELGYIYNDTISIKKENNPSLRLNEEQYKYTEQHFTIITLYRTLMYAVCMICTYLMHPQSITAILISLSCPILFYTYNNWRTKSNAFLYFFLVCSRFIPFAFLFENNFFLLIFIILIYPLEIGIERFSMPKYRYHFISSLIPNEKSKHKFRAYFYLSASLILSALYFLSVIPSVQLIIPFYIFTLYRGILLYKQRI